MIPFRNFLAQVSSELYKNKLDSQLGRRARADSDSDDSDQTDDDNEVHTFCSLLFGRSLIQVTGRKKQIQMRCKMSVVLILLFVV
jgi:hypothetical protein